MRVPTLRLAGLAVGAVLAVTTLAGCSDDEAADAAPAPDPVAPAPVGLTLADEASSDAPVKVGLLVSLSSTPGQGAEALPSAGGAQVAAYRFRMAGIDVELEVANDRGTRQGAQEAVTKLVDAGVSGIVAATSGDHLLPALTTASDAGTAVLAPYLRTGEALPDGVWTTGPTADAVGDALVAALDEEGLSKPFVVTGNGVELPGVVGPTARVDVTREGPRAVATRVQQAFQRGEIDSLVVGAAARTEASLVALVQSRVPALPVLLTPDALSPVFVERLVDAGGSPDGALLTVGPDAADTTTLGTTPSAGAAASYFAALRLAASDPDLEAVFGGTAFSEVAADADLLSHDAVVALVRGVAAAGSPDPAAVTTALGGLELGTADGLAGPVLDLTRADALADDAVVTLRATTQDPGVRPASADGGSRLFWFAVPRADG